MPPRYAYWTIIAGGLPTAFRAADREELLPTFRRIQEKHPDATMQWFARGKLWQSPDAARQALEQRRQGPSADARARRRALPGASTPDASNRPRTEPGGRAARPRDWRPGGQHRDPRQPFKDAKRERNQRRRAERFDRKARGATAPTSPAVPAKGSPGSSGRPIRRRRPGPRRS